MAVLAATPDASARRVDWRHVFKESALAAFVALMLTVTMVGLRTTDSGGSLIIETRFLEVAVAVLLVFLGRFGLVLIREGMPMPVLIGGVVVALAGFFLPMPAVVLRVMTIAGGVILALRAGWVLWRHSAVIADREAREIAMDRAAAKVQQTSRYVAPLAIAFAVALPFIPGLSDRSSIDIATLVLMYVMLGWGLNIIVGLAGLLDLGYVAFYAVGAYSYALLATHFGLSFWECLPLAGAFAACFGILLGFPVLRLRGDYLAIVTLGFGEIIRVILLNWYDFTNGPDGISSIPRPSFFGIAEFTRRPGEGETTFHQLFGLDYSTVHRVVFLYYLILALALIVNFFSLRVRKLPIGRSWEALREDDIACQALGINRRNIKLAAFTFSAMFGG